MMRRTVRATALSFLIAALTAAPLLRAAERIEGPAKPDRGESLAREARAGIQRALKYLEARQLPDGSWARHPAITGLVVTAMIRSGLDAYGPRSKPVTAGLEFIRRFAKKDGGIYDEYHANYTTSICLMALHEAGRPEDKETVRAARRFLLGLQADESEDIARTDPRYGGWGYEPQARPGMHKPDLSNLQWAIEALKVTEAVERPDRPGGAEQPGQSTALAYDKALTFLARCQNLKAVNDRPWAGNDGGFVYSPVESKAGETDDGKGLRSYGGMTYAGLKSMIYARLDPNDRRVRAAYDWIRSHWTLETNPELEAQGLFYYYQTMAKALDACGREIIVDTDGRRHDWRTELTRKLLSIQKGDGSWVNENARWMESIPELVTAYTVLALEATLSGWD
jgi:squalene-hopene/tetraprenyl-beta-curcumene cyclase